MQNLPSPLLGTAPANKQLEALQENIDTASKGIVRVPWIETPSDVRKAVEQSPMASAQRTPYNQQTKGGGQYRNALGNPMRPGQEAYDFTTKRYMGKSQRSIRMAVTTFNQTREVRWTRGNYSHGAEWSAET